MLDQVPPGFIAGSGLKLLFVDQMYAPSLVPPGFIAGSGLKRPPFAVSAGV